MAAGDLFIGVNTSNTDSVPNAGSTLDAVWEGQTDTGNIVEQIGANLRLDIGKYLVMYSEKFITGDTTNNERIQLQGEIIVDGTVAGGRGANYIRKTSGHQSAVVTGQTIIDVTSNDTDVVIRFERTDNSTSGTVDRETDFGGVFILQLDDTHNYAQYSNSGNQSTSDTANLQMGLDTTDQQDTGFSIAANTVTVTNAGRYVVLYEADLFNTATGREDIVGRLRQNGSAFTGGFSTYYSRGSDNCRDGAISWIGLVDVGANDTFDVQIQCPTSATITVSGQKLQMWQLPSGNNTIITEATNGNMNLLDQPFDMDTIRHIDGTRFAHTAGTSVINTNQEDYLLAFGSLGNETFAGTTRAAPEMRFRVNGTVNNTAASNKYNRNSGGAGRIGLNTAGIIQTTNNTDVELFMSRGASATGAVNNDTGQFALVSLVDIFGAYVFPPVISDMGDNIISPGENLIDINGTNFGAIQGIGKVELSDTANYTGTIVEQTVNSWSDTQINYDPVLTGLSDGILYLYVTNDIGQRTPAFQIFSGDIPYPNFIEALTPDHYWTLQNNYDDTGFGGLDRPMNTDIVGGGTFSGTALTRDSTTSWNANGVTVRRGCADSSFINLANLQERTMGGWIQTGGTVQKSFSAIYKEGGGVNNVAVILGAGNVLTAQYADTSDDNVQAFSDFKLTPGRPYHMIWRFSHLESPAEFRLFMDGVEQEITDGNPLTSGDLDSHSGDINWAAPDTNLETGGTDITYVGQEDTLYAFWATWSRALDKVNDIDIDLFRAGMPPDEVIASDSQANMQTAINAFSNTERRDWPLAIAISPPTGGGDLELTLDNITFDPGVTWQIEWRGNGTLTLVKANGADVDPARVYNKGGGTTVLAEDVPIIATISDIDDGTPIQNARLYLEADTGGPFPAGTVIANTLSNASGIATENLRFSVDQPVTGWVRSASDSIKYQQSPITATITANGLTLNVLMIKDQ